MLFKGCIQTRAIDMALDKRIHWQLIPRHKFKKKGGIKKFLKRKEKKYMDLHK
jgi:hypothetical protein